MMSGEDFGAIHCWLRELERRVEEDGRRNGTMIGARLESREFFEQLPAVRYNRERSRGDGGAVFRC